MQYPKDQGGMAIPRSFTYFMSVQLQYLTGWDLPVVDDPSRTLLIHSILEYSAMSQMEMGLPGISPDCPTVQLLLKLWVELKR